MSANIFDVFVVEKKRKQTKENFPLFLKTQIVLSFFLFIENKCSYNKLNYDSFFHNFSMILHTLPPTKMHRISLSLSLVRKQTGFKKN